MSGINWGALQQGGGFQNALAMGLQLGQYGAQQRDQRQLLQQRDRQIALQEQQAMRQAEQQAAKERRADLPLITRLLEGSTDQATYERNVGIAQQYGIDVSTLPQQFDPAWRDQQLATMRMLQTPEAQTALSTIGKEVADMGFQPGTREFNTEVARRWEQQQTAVFSYQPGGGAGTINKATGAVQQFVVPGNAAPQQMPQQPAPRAQANPGPRPQGMTDDQLFQMGREAVDNGAPIEEVFQRLKAWGVKVT